MRVGGIQLADNNDIRVIIFNCTSNMTTPHIWRLQLGLGSHLTCNGSTFSVKKRKTFSIRIGVGLRLELKLEFELEWKLKFELKIELGVEVELG